MTRDPVWPMVLAAAMMATLLASGCGNLDLGDNPGREVSKTDSKLTAFPKHLLDGAQ